MIKKCVVEMIKHCELQFAKTTRRRNSRGIRTFNLGVNAAFASSYMQKWGSQYLGRYPTLQYKPRIYTLDIKQPLMHNVLLLIS